MPPAEHSRESTSAPDSPSRPATEQPAEPPSFAGAGFDSDLAKSVKASAHEIWLAGMGAFAKAQQEGNKVFEALVKEGVGLQQKTQAAAEEQLQGLGDKVSALAEEVGEKATASWDKLESLFESRTAKAMKRLGVPTAAELAQLQAQVAQLQQRLAALEGHQAAEGAEEPPR